jgi:hypothetical protein
MVSPDEPIMGECICEPYSPESRAVGCEGCAPTMYVSCDEEEILAEMRCIKEQVRPISSRLKEIESLSDSRTAAGQLAPSNEWTELKRQLDNLRSQWRNWEERLDRAIERKLIMLGHREQTG